MYRPIQTYPQPILQGYLQHEQLGSLKSHYLLDVHQSAMLLNRPQILVRFEHPALAHLQ